MWLLYSRLTSLNGNNIPGLTVGGNVTLSRQRLRFGLLGGSRLLDGWWGGEQGRLRHP